MTALDIVQIDESLKARQRKLTDIIAELANEPGLVDHISTLREIVVEIENERAKLRETLSRTEVAPE